MSLILKGVDMPKEVNGTKLTLELYVRSDGKVLDDDLEEIAEAIQIPKGHGMIADMKTFEITEVDNRRCVVHWQVEQILEAEE